MIFFHNLPKMHLSDKVLMEKKDGGNISLKKFPKRRF